MSTEKHVRQCILHALTELSQELPADQIGFADVARRANVHWTTVRRHLGSRDAMRALLRAHQQASGVEYADTRTRILAAAERVFAEGGYANTSLDDVATAASLTKGAVYWHFSSKSDLFLSLLEKNVLDHVRLLPEKIKAIASASQGRESAVENWLTQELERLTADKRQSQLFFEFVSSSRDEAIETKMRDFRRRAFATALPLIEQLQINGLLTSDVPALTLGLMVHALFDGLTVAWMVDPQEVQPKIVGKGLAQLLMHGIGGPLIKRQ